MAMSDSTGTLKQPSIQFYKSSSILFQELMIFLLPLGVDKSSASSIYVRRIFRWKWRKHQESYLPSTHTRGYSNTTGLYLVWKFWQQAMDQVLEGIPQMQCILDDMIISGKTEQDHLNNLEMVLSRLHKHGLRANSSKCEFFHDKIEFCGHEISQDGLHKSQKKIGAVVNAPHPENVSQVRSFIGLINYYQHFLPKSLHLTSNCWKKEASGSGFHSVKKQLYKPSS